jgi:hypothetical protein
MNAATSLFCKTRTTSRLARRLALMSCALLMLVVLATLARAQSAAAQSPAPAQQQNSPTTAPSSAQKPADPDSKAGDAASLKPMSPKEAREAQIVADTNKLYELAQELQAEVAKSGKNTLSLAVVKKAAEVEKLARSLKERMKSE